MPSKINRPAPHSGPLKPGDLDALAHRVMIDEATPVEHEALRDAFIRAGFSAETAVLLLTALDSYARSF